MIGQGELYKRMISETKILMYRRCLMMLTIAVISAPLTELATNFLTKKPINFNLYLIGYLLYIVPLALAYKFCDKKLNEKMFAVSLIISTSPFFLYKFLGLDYFLAMIIPYACVLLVNSPRKKYLFTLAILQFSMANFVIYNKDLDLIKYSQVLVIILFIPIIFCRSHENDFN